ncbi:hypothetical protein NOVOSPHI9U_250034 [Novosphingobium sp. 9U]|nr:hypothetical protein NOVOSPHI9U_250034 [Novosphingobium sp. 9U]
MTGGAGGCGGGATGAAAGGAAVGALAAAASALCGSLDALGEGAILAPSAEPSQPASAIKTATATRKVLDIDFSLAANNLRKREPVPCVLSTCWAVHPRHTVAEPLGAGLQQEGRRP